MILLVLTACSANPANGGITEKEFERNFHSTYDEINKDLDNALSSDDSTDLKVLARSFVRFRKIDRDLYTEMNPPKRYEEVYTLILESLDAYIELGKAMEDLAYDSETDIKNPYDQARDKLDEAKEVLDSLSKE